MVIIEMEDGKKIKIELLSEHAPNTVKNFKSLVAKGFYNGLCFHRVISGFMIQGGCPSGSGTGGPGYGIKGEFAGNGVNNTLSHKRGVVSMARSAAMNSAGSQFFIVHGDSTFLDKQYAAFGRVTEGMNVVDEIAATKTNSSDKPKEPQVMKSVTLTEDEVVEEPEKM
jgi:peptidyl-prolyl cis-trans isomerase B (cyclophilin B)